MSQKTEPQPFFGKYILRKTIWVGGGGGGRGEFDNPSLYRVKSALY